MAAEGALPPTPATIGSVIGLPARTGQSNAPSSGRFIRIHLMEARGLLAARHGPLPPWPMSLLAPSSSINPAVRSPQSGQVNCAGVVLAAWTSSTTVWSSGPGPCESDAVAHILLAITS